MGNVTSGSEALAQAADILERDGWCQWSLRSEAGAWCATGALRHVINGGVSNFEPEDIRIWNEAIHLMWETVGSGFSWADDPSFFSMVIWNDNLEQTQENVIAKMREAASRGR